MSLRSRLVVALLGLALVPTAILTTFTVDQLDRAIARWYRPGVDRALASALEITKQSLARLESTVMVQANDWATAWPTLPAGEAGRAPVRASLRATGLDFLQVYRREGASWTPVESIAPAGVVLADQIDLGDAIAGALIEGQVIRAARGALAGIAALADGRVLVTGVRVAPDFFSQIESVATGTAHYRRLGVYVDVQRRGVGLLVAGVVFVILVMALLVATALARQMSRPLSDLSLAIGRVASGDLETRVAPRGASELRSLGASFNTMTERLADNREALQRAEREAAWRDVARKLAHEFKNLLTPMRLSLQLLEDQLKALDPDRRATADRSLRATLREVGHLDRLAEQFSQFARLPEPHLESLDLDELVRSTATLEPESPIDLGPEPPEPVLVRGDRLLLSRAVHNLLLNAREASPAGARVEARVRREGPEVTVEILDRGAGLPEDARDRLFEPYVSTKKRGSGLGLSLVRDIARQHRGRVTLENRPGGGALARLTLPASPSPPEKG